MGSLRPMKNQLTQAIAAIKYADSKGKKLNFHINGTRKEQLGENVLKNLEALFKDSKHSLVKHDWLNHKDFIDLILTMDCGLQVSLSETYNIVTADFVSNSIPVVCSNEIPFVAKVCKVSTKDIDEIAEKIDYVITNKAWLCPLNKNYLKKNSSQSASLIIKLLT